MSKIKLGACLCMLVAVARPGMAAEAVNSFGGDFRAVLTQVQAGKQRGTDLQYLLSKQRELDDAADKKAAAELAKNEQAQWEAYLNSKNIKVDKDTSCEEVRKKLQKIESAMRMSYPGYRYQIARNINWGKGTFTLTATSYPSSAYSGNPSGPDWHVREGRDYYTQTIITTQHVSVVSGLLVDPLGTWKENKHDETSYQSQVTSESHNTTFQ